MAKNKAGSASTDPKAAANKTAKATAEAKNAKATAASGNTVPKSSLTSAITTDLPNKPADDGMTEVDLSRASIRVPAESIATPAAPDTSWSDADEDEMTARDKSFEQRVIDYGIGLVQVEGIDFRYVGVAPARDKDAKTEFDYPVTPMNSRFTPLFDVAFHPSVRCKDAKTGKFYFPTDGTASWAEVESPDGNLLVPKEPHKASAAARREALKAARSR